jgi:hypothetical protein
MGDAFFAVLGESEDVYKSCVSIAKDLDRLCEYISIHQKTFSEDWLFSLEGPSLKIAVEYGWMDVSTIHCRSLGKQRLLIGPPINYASRISYAGKGNRCLLGPCAVDMHGMNQWRVEGPQKISPKNGEPEYIYYELDIHDIWRAGPRQTNEETYRG